MTGPQRPVDAPLPVEPGWDDERLEAAFAARAARTAQVPMPGDLVVTTLERLQPAARRSPWARLLPVSAGLVLILGVIGGGVAMLGGPAGLLGTGAVTFRDGPTPELRTLDGGEYALDFPASWLSYTATAMAGSGGSIDAVLTTQPIEERCNGISGVDINCVYEQRLEPGQLRIFIGNSSYRGQTVPDRADIENGTTTHLGVGGMPAILDEFDDEPDDYYLADQSASWAIATPTSLARVIRIEFMAREPGAGAARTAVDALVASFRFTPAPATSSDAGLAPARSCDEPWPDTAITCESAVRLGDQAGARVDQVRIWLTSLGAVRTTMAPEQQTDLPADQARVWAVVFDGAWDCCPGAIDERGEAIPITGWTRWLVVVEADREGTGFVYLQDWSDRAVPDRLLAAPRPEPTPRPPADADAWPPAGTTTTIALSSQVGEGQPPVEVAIVDRSGLLVSAREVRPGDPVVSPTDADAAHWVGREPLDPRSLRLGWAGGVCDSRVTITIETLESILIDGGPQPECDAMGVGREIILSFARPVDATFIELRYTETRIGAPSDPVGPTWREVIVDDPGPSQGWCAVAPFRDAVVAIVTVIDAGPDGMDQCSGVVVSQDGERWSGPVVTPFGSDAMTELVVVGARIVALGARDGPSDANVIGGERAAWWSSDGRTWTEIPRPNGVVSFPWAIGRVGDAIVATSNDGVYMLVDDVWRRTADLGSVTSIASSGAAAIAVRVEDDPEPADRLYWTPDGHQWTAADLPADAPELAITSLAAGRQRFVAIGAVGPYQGQAPAAWWSADGRTWTAAEVPPLDEGVSFRVEDVADLGDGFVAHGWLDGGASFARLLWWSPDGRRWFDIEAPAASDSDNPTVLTSIDDRVYLFSSGRIAVGTVGRP